MMMRSIMSNDCCSALPNLSGPMQRSFGLIVCIPIRSIPDGSNRHHGVNRIYLLSRSLFHLFAVEALELVLAEEQLRHYATDVDDDAFAFATLLGFGAAFDLPVAGVLRSRRISGGTGVSAIAVKWASDM